MSDATVLANAQRQAQLEAQHRDLTKPVPPPGTDGASIRQLKGFEGITDEMLQERATFNLKDHMAKLPPQITKGAVVNATVIDLKMLSKEELLGLVDAAAQELAQKENQ